MKFSSLQAKEFLQTKNGLGIDLFCDLYIKELLIAELNEFGHRQGLKSLLEDVHQKSSP